MVSSVNPSCQPLFFPTCFLSLFCNSSGCSPAAASGAYVQAAMPPPTPSRPDRWSQLPPYLLRLIAGNLQDLPDLFRFGAVCTTWRYATAEQRRRQSRGLVQLPLLLLHRDTPRGTTLAFFCTRRGRFLDQALPAAFLRGNVRCCGSSWGWLAMVNDAEFDVCLLNPVTRARVPLPSGTRFPFRPAGVTHSEGSWNPVRYLKKVVMSSDPASRGCTAAAIGRSNVLALCRLGRGQDRWTTINVNHGRGYEDVAFHGDRLFALDFRGALTICSLAASVRGVTELEVMKPWADVRRLRHLCPRNWHLVGSCGELLLVERKYDAEAVDATEVRVFRLGMHNAWEAVGSLGERMLFVGEVSSASLAAEKGAVPGFRANCVYFTRRMVERATPRAYGVFCMEAGLFPVSDGDPRPLLLEEPVWVMATFR